MKTTPVVKSLIEVQNEQGTDEHCTVPNFSTKEGERTRTNKRGETRAV
jgi:hypothetical protein